MSAEEGEKVEHRIQNRMNPGDPAADRRGQGQPPVVDFPVGEQFPNALERYATNIRIARVVVDEVISEDPSAGFYQRPHPIGQFLLKAVIKDRSKYSGLINNIKRAFAKIDLRRIPYQNFYALRQPSSGHCGQVLQKLVTDQVFRN
jgi:hypothetical protein